MGAIVSVGCCYMHLTEHEPPESESTSDWRLSKASEPHGAPQADVGDLSAAAAGAGAAAGTGAGGGAAAGTVAGAGAAAVAEAETEAGGGGDPSVPPSVSLRDHDPRGKRLPPSQCLPCDAGYPMSAWVKQTGRVGVGLSSPQPYPLPLAPTPTPTRPLPLTLTLALPLTWTRWSSSACPSATTCASWRATT